MARGNTGGTTGFGAYLIIPEIIIARIEVGRSGWPLDRFHLYRTGDTAPGRNAKYGGVSRA